MSQAANRDRGTPDPETTDLLLLTRSGRAGSTNRDRLFVVIYDDLRRLARSLMRGQGPDHILRPTALVHELFLRLVDQTRIDASDRARFMSLAAQAMRQILVDHARRKNAARRGGGWKRVTLSESIDGVRGPSLDMIALERALERLADADARAQKVAEMRLFAGLSSGEIGAVLGVSERTAAGDWAYARRFLAREMKEP
jgi:RNA polymerase sigma factor (TIGR02999 family)